MYSELCDFGGDAGSEIVRLNDLPARLAASCRKIGVPLLDLTDGLRRSRPAGRLVYFVDDAHWSPEGHTVVAEEVAAWIRRGKVPG